MDKDLNGLREEIDAIDARILDLLEQRIDVVREIGAYKKEHGLTISAPVRELEILKDIYRNRRPGYSRYLARIFQQIFTESKNIQENGPEK
jgi:monofunctional chorismate mutase